MNFILAFHVESSGNNKGAVQILIIYSIENTVILWTPCVLEAIHNLCKIDKDLKEKKYLKKNSFSTTF